MGRGAVRVVGCPPVTDAAATHETVATPAGDDGTPEPLLPDWDGPCLHHVVPALLRRVGGLDGEALPSWLPDPVAEAEQIVLLVIDGLGAEQMRERPSLTPVLSSGS